MKIFRDRKDGGGKALPFRSVRSTGQMMILAVIALGGTILGVTTIAGLLMLYQIRQATDAASSAKAVFAADAGLEWALYNLYCLTEASTTKSPCPLPGPPTFSNNASVLVRCFDGNGDILLSCSDAASASSTRNVRAIGRSGDASRAFQIAF